MSENNIVKQNVSLDALLAKIASLEAQMKVSQTPRATSQVTALPVGKQDAKCVPYLRWIPVPAFDRVTKKPIMAIDKNPKSPYFGQLRQKANFRPQHCKEIVITWANGAEVRFMKTEHSPKIHDSRTPTMVYNADYVTNELKRIIGNDVNAIKGAKWLDNVRQFNKADKTANYVPLKEMPSFTPYFKLYGNKPKQPRQTVSPVAPSVPLSQEADEAVVSETIPF